MEMMLEEAPADLVYTEEAEEEPMILLWDEQPEPGIGGAQNLPASGMGGEPPAEEAPMAESMVEGEAMPMEEAAPAAEGPGRGGSPHAIGCRDRGRSARGNGDGST